MAHFAKIGKGNIVEDIIVIDNNDAPNETAGQEFIKKTYNDTSLWLQTSYNTKAGVHLLGGTPFRMKEEMLLFLSKSFHLLYLTKQRVNGIHLFHCQMIVILLNMFGMK